MNWIEQIVTALLKWLSSLARQDKTSEDANTQDALRADMLHRIDAHEQRVRDARGVRQERDSGSPGGTS